VLAVQMPHSFDEPSHRLMREVRARSMPARTAVNAATPVAEAAFYYDLLAPHATAVDIWRTTYEHVMPDLRVIRLGRKRLIPLRELEDWTDRNAARTL